MNPEHLLDQADGLCRPATGRPRQADLRRAASACYYSLFHRLIELTCRQLVGAAADRGDARNVLSRAFVHGEMRDASRTFAGGTLPQFLAGRYAGASTPAGVRHVAAAFLRLQEERHAADYDRSVTLSQRDVIALVSAAREAVALADRLKSTDLGRLYLLTLLTWGKLRR